MMLPGVTVVPATVWLAVCVAMVGASNLHPSRLTPDQYASLISHRHELHRGTEEDQPFSKFLNDSDEDQYIEDSAELQPKGQDLAKNQPVSISISSYWKDQGAADQANLPISSGKSFNTGRFLDPQDFELLKHLEKNLLHLRLENSAAEDFSPLSRDNQLLEYAGQQLLDQNINVQESSERARSPLHESPPQSEDHFVADDTFQDQGPGSVEIYKLDLLRERLLPNPMPTSKLPMNGKSKVPKKTTQSNEKTKTTEHKTVSPKMFHKQSNSFDDHSSDTPPNTDPFSIGGVPELQVGCEGLAASRQKRSIDSVSKAQEGDLWSEVTPISLDLDYDLSEEKDEEMDELFKLKKLETTTKGMKQNRGDIEATLYGEDDEKRPDKLPVRGDLGESSTVTDSATVTPMTVRNERKFGEPRSYLKIKRSVQSEDTDVPTGERPANQMRKILWIKGANADDEANRRRDQRWGFDEMEGVVSSDELNTENQRRRQFYERLMAQPGFRKKYRSRQERASGEREVTNSTNADIDRIRSEYEKHLAQKEEEERRRMSPDSRSSRWQQEEEHRRRLQIEAEKNRRLEEERRRPEALHRAQERRLQTSSPGPRWEEEEARRQIGEEARRWQDKEETRRRYNEEEARRRHNEEEAGRRNNEEEARRRHNEEEARRRNNEEEARMRHNADEARRRHNEEEARMRHNADEARRRNIEEEARRRYNEEEPRKTNNEEESRRRYNADEARKRNNEEEARRRYNADEARKRNNEEEARRRYNADEARKRNNEEEARRRHDEEEARRRNNTEEARRRQQEQYKVELEARRREWMLKKHQKEGGERRKKARDRIQPSNTSVSTNENEPREQWEREQKLQEYIQRNQPVNIGDTADRRTQEANRRRMEQDRKLLEYIRRNQPLPDYRNDWTKRKMEEAGRDDRLRYPSFGGGRRDHGPSATMNVEPRNYEDEARRRNTARKTEEDRIRERERLDEERLREEARRRELEIQRLQSKRYEEQRQRIEAERRATQEHTGKTSPLENMGSPYGDRRRFEDHSKRQETSLVPANLVTNEARRAAENARQIEEQRKRFEESRRRMENARRRPGGNRATEAREKQERARDEKEQWRRQEVARLNALPVIARIIIHPGAHEPTPRFDSRIDLGDDIEFTGFNPHGKGVPVPNFPAPPTRRPPVKSPSPCVWAVVTCCPSKTNRLVTCFESMGCPGINWGPNPCRVSVTKAAREQVMKFYEENDEDQRF
ncbi:uncharacterized protein LOC143213551 isoform X2 [Lasioglossum baleicum]